MDKIKEQYHWPKECPKRDYFMHGWLGEANKRRLTEALEEIENPVVLEIGCWLGKSAEFFLLLNPNLKLVTVDAFEGSKELEADREAQEIISAGLYEQAVRNLWLYKNRTVIVKQKSVVALKELSDFGLKPDLIYIDGSHQYRDALSDIKMSLDFFKDAIVCGDDARRFDLPRVLDEIEKEYNVIIYGDNDFWMIER